MSHDIDSHGQDLQFDRAITGVDRTPGLDKPAVVCEACHQALETEYYDVNGYVSCAACRTRIEAHAEPPRGIAPLAIAAAYGLGAGIVGAIIYYGVIAIANLEIGFVAILIGYMVGYSVRKGAGGRGGRRFQILAVALTYASVALAYAPLALKGAAEHSKKEQATASKSSDDTTDVSSKTSAGQAAVDPRAPSFIVALAVLFGIIAALPLFVVFGGLPLSLISGIIIAVGMRQAWTMTGAPTLVVTGPYRVGAASPVVPA